MYTNLRSFPSGCPYLTNLNTIANLIGDGDNVDMSFLDLSKTFDAITYTILLTYLTTIELSSGFRVSK